MALVPEPQPTPQRPGEKGLELKGRVQSMNAERGGLRRPVVRPAHAMGRAIKASAWSHSLRLNRKTPRRPVLPEVARTM